MPRLKDDRILKGQAVAALVNLYRWDKDFAHELDEIRDPYIDLIIEFALYSFESGRKLYPLTKRERKTKIKSASSESVKDITPKLEPYYEALNQLAHKWKLRTPWATSILMLFDTYDVLRAKELIPHDIDIPLETYELLYPWKAPLDPLDITVPAWSLILEGREKVITTIRKKLQDYESELKAIGLKEYPSSIKKHAEWWFKHYVHGKKYDEIAQEEIRSLDDSYIVYARNVGRAVRSFSRLIGINPLDLKK